MIEMLGVLAIIGILSAGGIMGYSAAMDNYRYNKLVNDMGQMVTTAHYLFPKPVQTARIMCGRLYQVGVLPKEYYDKMTNKNLFTGGTGDYTKCPTKHPFNGAMLLKLDFLNPAHGSYGTSFLASTGETKDVGDFIGNQMQFYLYNLPKSACVKILTTDWKNTGATIVFGGVGSASIGNIEYPRSRTEAETICESKPTQIFIGFVLNGKNSR